MKVSDWIHTNHNMKKITGFVIDINESRVAIYVTIPKNYGALVMNQNDVWLADESIWMDDIPTLIDLSLMIGDREWFEKWTKELSMWKEVEKVHRVAE